MRINLLYPTIMDLREQHFLCDYVDASIRPANDMLYNCVQVPSKGYDFHCQMNADPIDRKNTSYTDNSAIDRGYATSGQTEGFTNMFVTDNGPGKSTVPAGECPEGYSRCPQTGKCKQVCISCSYRDNMKSREFNEADPCFPNGVYNGITSDGSVKCTCGQDNQYCSQKFVNQYTSDGGLVLNGQNHIVVGASSLMERLFSLGQL